MKYYNWNTRIREPRCSNSSYPVWPPACTDLVAVWKTWSQSKFSLSPSCCFHLYLRLISPRNKANILPQLLTCLQAMPTKILDTFEKYLETFTTTDVGRWPAAAVTWWMRPRLFLMRLLMRRVSSGLSGPQSLTIVTSINIVFKIFEEGPLGPRHNQNTRQLSFLWTNVSGWQTLRNPTIFYFS